MDIEHATNFKMGGFVAIRHNDLQDLTMDLLIKLCSDAEIEPELVTATNTRKSDKTRNKYS